MRAIRSMSIENRRQDSFVADYGARKPAWISGRGDTRGPGGWGGYPN